MTMKVGTNLTAGGGPTNTEVPFINIFKSAGGWTPVTGSPGAWVSDIAETFAIYTTWLDSNGYVTTFGGGGLSFTGVATTVLNGFPSPPFYKSGDYIFKYDGTGSFDFGRDAVYVSGAGTGRIVIHVTTPSTQGISIIHYATGTGVNQAKNFRLCYSTDEAALDSGEIFTPEFVTKSSGYDTFRFMKWTGIDTQTVQINWADRVPQSYVFWYGSRINATQNACDPNAAQDGVPVEVLVALCNKINANGWFCMPGIVTDDYITQFATLVHSTLNSNLKVYVEYANEIWNSQLGLQNLGSLTGSCSGTVLTVTAISSNGFGGPYLRGGRAGVQLQDGITNEVQIVSQASGTPGGIGTYNLSKTSSLSGTIPIVLQGVTQVSNLALNVFPFLQSFSLSNSQLNNAYACAAACRTFDLWKTAWGADAARVVRVFGGFGGNDSGYTIPQLSNTVSNLGSETASFTGTISGTTLTVSGVSGTIVIEHKLTGSGVAAGTYIQSGSGTTWTVNNSQTVGPVAMTSSAWTGTVASNSDACCEDSYLDHTLVVPNTATLDQFFQELLTGGMGWTGSYTGGVVKQTGDNAAGNLATCQSFTPHLLLLNYEGGWSFFAGNNATLETLFLAAIADSRMYTVFTNWLNALQTAGVSLCVNFTDISAHTPASGGFSSDWGALESVYQTTAPKYQALKDFITTSSGQFGCKNMKGRF